MFVLLFEYVLNILCLIRYNNKAHISTHSELEGLAAPASSSSRGKKSWHAAHAPHTASHAPHAASAHEHGEDIVDVDSVHASPEAGPLVAIKVDLARVVHLLLLGVGEAAIGLGDLLELFGGLLLLGFALGSVPVGVVFEGKGLVNFLDLSISGISIHSEYFVVVLLAGLLFLFLGDLNLLLHVAGGVDLLDLAVVHDGGSVLSPLHVDLGPPDEGFGVFRVQFKGFVEIVQSLEGFLPFDEGQGSVREYYCVQLLVGWVQVDGVSVLLLSFLELLVFDELVALLL